MRTIDGVRYISAKEYAEMMNLTPARVSQLKSDLPFVKFEEFGIEVINFDLLALSQTEKTLAQTKFQTATPIHELSYKDLGNYFGKFVMDLVVFKGAADSQIDDLQTKASHLGQKLDLLENQKTALSSELSKLESLKSGLQASLELKTQENDHLASNLVRLNEAQQGLQVQHEEILKEYQDLKIIDSERKHEIEIKIIENKNLLAENESLKIRLATMELSAKSDTDFRLEFTEFKELMMSKMK